jgi:hypothetical protein
MASSLDYFKLKYLILKLFMPAFAEAIGVYYGFGK